MAQPRIFISDHSNLPIYAFHSGSRIGTLYQGELFVSAGYTMISNHTGRYEEVYWAYTSGAGWAMCRMYFSDRGNALAYSHAHRQYADQYGRPVFLVRRKCRIFKGTTEITSIYSGDAVVASGSSESGSSRPYRLAIRGYRKGGVWREDSNLWCDTDIEIGYSSNPTVYGIW